MVFLLASSFLFVVDDVVVAGGWEEGLVGIGDWGLVVVMRKKGHHWWSVVRF